MIEINDELELIIYFRNFRLSLGRKMTTTLHVRYGLEDLEEALKNYETEMLATFVKNNLELKR